MRTLFLFAACLVVGMTQAAAAPTYQEPTEAMARLVDMPLTPRVYPSPDHRYVAFFEREGTRPLADLAAEEVRLAGTRIRPATFAPSRVTPFHAARVMTLGDGTERALALPEGRILWASWSPNSQWLAFVAEEPGGLMLWAFNPRTGDLRRVSDRALNGVLGRPYTWDATGDAVLARLAVNAGQTWSGGDALPTGPVIQETGGTKAAVRTYQDLLTNEQDAAHFAFLAESQVARIGLAEGRLTELGAPDLYLNVERSPDGAYLLAERLARPFSYIVPWWRFPITSEVWTPQGDAVATVAELPLAENVPPGFDSVREGRRNVTWRADAPATLVWMEAQDGGNMKTEVDVHDIAYGWPAPFDADPAELFRFELRGRSLTWGDDGTALASSWRFADRLRRVEKFSPNGAAAPVLWQERSYNDAYGDPGWPAMTLGAYGTSVLRLADDGSVLLTGRGASPEGLQPFVDRYHFDTQATERLWQSTPPHFERPYTLLDDGQLLFTREAPDENPNFFVATLGTDTERQLTAYPHPTPELRNVSKELISYRRADGVELSGTLYLPPGHDPATDGPLPVLMWAYPLEYKDAAVAGQVRDSPYEFNRIRPSGPLPHLLPGHRGVRRSQDADHRRGRCAPQRRLPPATGRRSPGGHRRLGRAGGCPIQSGWRLLGTPTAPSWWRTCLRTAICSPRASRAAAPTTARSPRSASKARSATSGKGSPCTPRCRRFSTPRRSTSRSCSSMEKPTTTPARSRCSRSGCFAAVKGLGGTARLVMLPHESHGYRSRTSMLHVLWEQSTWLEQTILGEPLVRGTSEAAEPASEGRTRRRKKRRGRK